MPRANDLRKTIISSDAILFTNDVKKLDLDHDPLKLQQLLVPVDLSPANILRFTIPGNLIYWIEFPFHRRA